MKHTLLKTISKVIHVAYDSFYKLCSSIIPSSVERLVIGSKLSSSIDKYIRVVSSISLAATVAGGLTSSYLLIVLTGDVLISYMAGLAISIATFLASIAFSIWIPAAKYSSRGSLLEAKMPIFLSHLSLLLASRIDVNRAFIELEGLLKDLRIFDVELLLINSLTSTGVPLSEALVAAAQVTPSPTMKELFLGLTSIAKAGGDPMPLLNSMMESYVSRYNMRVERAVGDLAIILEFYVAFSILLPIVLSSLALLFTIQPIHGLPFELLLFISVFVLAPIMLLSTMIMADAIVSKLRL
ncbi:MAG: type II secretion system F family protein [Sulfolobales archaeon]|nr:type II secretion system F family protein [Sulfolobales archaeon]MCX8198906.1 type II secretion system F family protein [Sulfolobales archaeon]MDW8169884.1 type II secretion system F family protein [Desulfurococcaceae archaeon]